MNAFDRAMNHLDKAYSFSDNEHQYVSRKVIELLSSLHTQSLTDHLPPQAWSRHLASDLSAAHARV